MQVKHKSNLISVEIIKDSYNPEFSSRITTMILEYPRIIHSELMTHRLFSRNASSSRAIPVSKVIEQVRNNPAMPVRFGKNQAGMSDAGEHNQQIDLGAAGVDFTAKEVWQFAANRACNYAEAFLEAGYHKQVINRILEPYQFIRVCITSTNWNNWFNLRNHPDADPTIHALAETMEKAMDESVPVQLEPNHWHIPFVETYHDKYGNQIFFNNGEITLEQALVISASCAAQTSYRKLDNSLEKAEDIYKKLIESKPCHASPVEHSCMAIAKMENPMDYFNIKGITHVDRNGIPWSGNLHGVVQYRQLIEGNAEYY